MKNKFLIAVTLSVLLLSVFVAAQAPPERGRRFGDAGRPGNPPDPQQMLQDRIERLAGALSLTDAQKTQATTIFTDAATASRPLMSQLRETRRSLQGAVKSNNVAQIDQLANTVGSLTAQITAIESKAEAQFISILTEEQKNKLPEGVFGGFGGFGGRRGPPPSR